MDQPRTIPEDLPADEQGHLTALACPECSGTLTVQRRGERELSFCCRIGHGYLLPELLAGKEGRLEFRLWSAVAAFEELAALLRDVGHDPERMLQVERHAALVRQIIEESRYVRIDGLGVGAGQIPSGQEGP